MTDQDQDLIAELQRALSPERVRFDSAERALLARDASVFRGGLCGPVCFPVNTAEVRAIVRIANRHGRAIVPRGAGTGLAGGAIPLGAPVVVSTTKMGSILEVDTANRTCWVEPGVVNLELTRYLAGLGFHFAPDPSSQQVCTIGGNVANNSGGPHCLAYGVTSQHVLALRVITPEGDEVTLGGLDPEPDGLDLRGAFVGSEGTMGIVTAVAVRITRTRPVTRTMLMAFADIEAAARTVSAVISAGVVPAAMEVMDKPITVAVEAYVHAGYPTDAGAVLLVDVDGLPASAEADAARVQEIALEQGATSVILAESEEQRGLLWKGRKTAFGAVAQIAPSYYLHDTVVPRAALATVLAGVYRIADDHGVLVVNVFHAGDGNLHPLILFDPREPGILDRVHAAGREIVELSLASGGVLSGEHGIGVEKRDFMSLLFSDDDLDHQNRLRRAFDPQCRANPGKVLPSGHSCADIQALTSVPTEVWG